jgi:hypothetical protein
MQCASFDSFDQRANLHAAIAIRREGGRLRRKKQTTRRLILRWQARRFYEGFALIQQTDGAHNEEKEPDALYLWRRA